MKLWNKLCSLALALTLILSLCAPASFAAGENTVIYINSAEDLVELSSQCSLDSWSQGKTVLLECDIDLSSVEFLPIPTFGGTFDGQGHTISGFTLEGSGNVRGLFRYIQESGVVQNLTVEGSILPTESKNYIGGIAGNNRGTISYCTFRGTVTGKNTVGGLVGLNEASAQIIHCTFSGSVTAEHYVGGIAGQNLGSIVQCENSGDINTAEVKSTVSLEELDLGQLTNMENTPASTDIGGIAGFSSGVIQSCRNTGSIGYPHVGYNVGGIAGRQSGYLDFCTNEGMIRGRKDVGGIVGQLEPQLTLKYDETTLNQVWAELDSLESIIDALLTDTSGSAHSLTAQIQAVSDSAGTVKTAVSDLSSALTDWADGSIDRINDASARISWVMERMDPILDTVESAANQLEVAAGQCSDGLSQTSTAVALGADAAAEMSLAMEDIETAIQDGRAAFEHIRQAVSHANQGFGSSSVASKALDELTDGLTGAASAFSAFADGLHRIRLAMDQVYVWIAADPSWALLKTGVEDLLLAAEDISAAFGEIGTAAESISKNDDMQAGTDSLLSAARHLLSGMEHMGNAYYDLSDALEQFQSSVSPRLISYIKTGLQQLGSSSGTLSSALSKIKAAGEVVSTDVLDQLSIVGNYLESGITSIENAEFYLTAALDSLGTGDPETLDTALQNLRAAIALLRSANTNFSLAAEQLSAAIRALNNNDTVGTTQSYLLSALSDLSGAADSFSSACYNFSAAVALLEGNEMKQVSARLGDGLDDLDRATSDLISTSKEFRTALDTIEYSATLNRQFENLKTGAEHLTDGIIAVSDAMNLMNTALAGIDASAVPEDTAAALRLEAALLDQHLQQAGNAIKRITAALDKLEENLDLAAFETALSDLERAIEDLDLAANGFGEASGHMKTAMSLIEDAADELAAALDSFSLAGTSLEQSFSLWEQTISDVDTLLEELVQMPAIQFEHLDDHVANESSALNNAVSGFLDSVDSLNLALRTEVDVLTDDLKGVNEQIGSLVDLLHQFQQEQAEIETESPLEDVSAQDSNDTRSTGKISACTNLGTVEGDVNVAGIVGSMAIEYDFDPEDDLTISGSRTLESRYLVRAVVRDCINCGSVTAKKNHAGGIVGIMDFGRVISCEGYGSVASTSGSYVGGIAGTSYGGIQDSWAMCHLSGNGYVGGIVGLGNIITNCRSLICLDTAGVNLGAIAGQVEEGADLSGNLFVHHSLAGVDGISYAGLAEPVSYDVFCTLEHLPAAFTEFELVFVADGATVLTVPFRYGDHLTQLPDIPEMSGFSAQWPDIDYSYLTFSQTLEAIYTPYSTAISDGSLLPQYLVSGSFSPAARISVTQSEETWANIDGIYTGTAYTVTVDDPSILGVDYTLHWRLEGDAAYTLWVFNGAAWEQQTLRTDGSYLLLDFSVDGITFCLIPQAKSSVLFLVLALAAVVIVVIAVIVVVRLIRTKRKQKAAAVVSSEKP